MWELINEIGQSLSRNRTRTFLTGVAVVWGIFMLIVLLGMARGVVNANERGMSERNYETVSIYGGMTVYPYRGYDAGRPIRLRDSDIDPIKHENTRYVEDVIVTLSNDTAVLSTPKGYRSGGFQGVYPDMISSEPVSLIRGRYINQRDMDERRRVMVMSRRRAEQLFESVDSAYGSMVQAQGLAWKVVGIYDHHWRNTTYVPFATAKMLAGNSPNVGNMTVIGRNLQTKDDAEAFQDGIVATLARLHEFDKREGANGGLWIWNRFENYLSQKEATSILLNAVWIIGVLTLLTGIVGISNIMFVAVKERTHEIGIRRAIGAKPRSILKSIVVESVAITLLFGYIGVVLGMAVVAVIGHFVTNEDILYNPGISLTMAFEVTVVLIVAGAVAGLSPAIKATKVSPVEALRDE